MQDLRDIIELANTYEKTKMINIYIYAKEYKALEQIVKREQLKNCHTLIRSVLMRFVDLHRSNEAFRLLCKEKFANKDVPMKMGTKEFRSKTSLVCLSFKCYWSDYFTEVVKALNLNITRLAFLVIQDFIIQYTKANKLKFEPT